MGRTEPEVPSIELPVVRDMERENERVWPGRQLEREAETQERELTSNRGMEIEM